MSTITTEQFNARMEQVARHPAMAHDNVNLREGAGAGASVALLAIGVGAIALTVVGGVVHGAKHASAAYMIGVFTVLAICLGGAIWHWHTREPSPIERSPGVLAPQPAASAHAAAN